MASALGQPSQLLALLCQPAEVQGCVPLPRGLAVWGIDSGLRHCVGGSDYGAVRVGAFMGLRILSSAAHGRPLVGVRACMHAARRQRARHDAWTRWGPLRGRRREEGKGRYKKSGRAGPTRCTHARWASRNKLNQRKQICPR